MHLRHLSAAVAVGAVAALATSAHAIDIFEDFESYSSTAEMLAVWPGGPATLDTGFGYLGGQSAAHPEGVVNQQTFAAVLPTVAEPLVLSGQIYDDGVGPQDTATIGLRGVSGGTTENIIELGHWNDATTVGTSQYAYRLVLFGAGEPNWVPFNVDGAGANTSVEGWHTYSAVILPDSITLTLDLGSDGTIDATHSHNIVTTATGYTSLRFGGPSNINGNPEGVVHFDNISLSNVIPEPTSLALLGVGGLGLLRRRR